MGIQYGFIGCGNMGSALIRAAAQGVSKEAIGVYDVHEAKAQVLRETCGVSVCSPEQLCREAEILFLGVKPQGFAELFETLRPLIAARKDLTLCSMAAGVSIQAVRDFAGQDFPVIRIMPNLPVACKEGMILCCYDRVSSPVRKAFAVLMEKAGRMDEIDESKIDAAAALSGCGPAYVCLLIESLADGAVACGISRSQATLYAIQTVLGTAEFLRQTESSPAALKDAVCSPGGTTIAGVLALEENRFRSAGAQAVIQAYRRTLEMKK